MRKADKVFEQKPSVDALLITSEKNRFYYTGFASTFGYLVMLCLLYTSDAADEL